MIKPIFKPKGWTSFDVVNKIRHITHEKRVGHAGTLDPMAEGVLVVAVGRESTKQLGQLMLGRKVYEAEITLGGTSNTDDAEGEIKLQAISCKPQREEIKERLRDFEGEIEQVPPQFSAIKMGGKPAYKLARAGKEVIIEPRQVVVDQIELIRYEWPKVEIRVYCQKGVYIRSIARDLGEKLGVGGYLSKLTRTRVGEYTLENCLTLDEFKDKIAS